MDIAKCEVLLRAVDAGSFSAAAAKLGYTPSGVVRMVNSLEAEVGFPLVARSSHGITLTENGREMLPLFRQLIYWHKMARQRSSAIRGLDIGNLDIGTYFTQGFFEGRVFLLFFKDLQALHQRQTGVDHRRKLAGEDDNVLAGDLRFEQSNIFQEILRFLLMTTSVRRYFLICASAAA